MVEPGLSCVTIVRGFSELLEESVFSFIIQDWGNRELIIVNTNPEQDLIFDNPSVKVVNCLNRVQAIESMRDVVKTVARHDWIVLWHAGSIFFPEYLGQLAEAIKQDVEVVQVVDNLAYRGGRLEIVPDSTLFMLHSEKHTLTQC